MFSKEETVDRELVFGASLFILVDGVFYYVEGDKMLRLIPPATDWHQLFLEAHEGPFAGHLREAKIFGQLARHYWWRGMSRDIEQWCQACLTCTKPGYWKNDATTVDPNSGAWAIRQSGGGRCQDTCSLHGLFDQVA